MGIGINFILGDIEVKTAYKRDVKFSHFIQREEKRVEGQLTKSSVRVRVQLQTNKSQEEAFTIICDAFLAHLKRLLRIAVEEGLDDSVSLVDHGVDSLVAVDIRGWFLKELEFDVPTLKILGGGSIADLVKSAVERLPEMLDGASPKDAGESRAQTLTPSIPVPELFPPASNAHGSSSGSRTPDTTPASQSRGSVSTTPDFEESPDKLEISIESKAVKTLEV